MIGDISGLHLALLCVAALAAGIVDAIGGGGGLITLPALLAAGFPPTAAIAINKGQAVFGSGASLLHFARSGMINTRWAAWTFPCGLAGSCAGACLVLVVHPTVLRPLVFALLVGVAVFFVVRPHTAPHTIPLAIRSPRWVAAAIALIVAAYDGFFGPGTGTFLILAFIGLMGCSPMQASADAKVVNFASNLASVIWFATQGLVVWHIALPMAVAQFVGGTIGATLTMSKGDSLVRHVMMVVVACLLIKLGTDLFTIP